MIATGEFANTFGVSTSSLLSKPRVGNPGLQLANAFGVMLHVFSLASKANGSVTRHKLSLSMTIKGDSILRNDKLKHIGHKAVVNSLLDGIPT